MEFKYFSRNGKILPIAEAVVPLSNIEYQYGFGVYENIRVHEGVPYFLTEHLERLVGSARIIGLEHPFPEADIRKNAAELIKKSGKGTYNVKILLVGGAAPALYCIPFNPHFPDKKLYRDGADFVTYEYERPFPHAKTLNMLQSYLAYKKARESSCYDALLINSKGCITEGTRTNFLIVRGRTLVSPPEEEILLGVMRKVVLHVAIENGFALEEREMRFSDILESDGAFVTSTSAKILPVRSIDSQLLKQPSPEFNELTASFERFLTECKGVLATESTGS
jgi:branched-subunit amino acid aminotransferase/4-amino-4-deoxychorismate lyase